MEIFATEYKSGSVISEHVYISATKDIEVLGWEIELQNGHDFIGNDYSLPDNDFCAYHPDHARELWIEGEDFNQDFVDEFNEIHNFSYSLKDLTKIYQALAEEVNKADLELKSKVREEEGRLEALDKNQKIVFVEDFGSKPKESDFEHSSEFESALQEWQGTPPQYKQITPDEKTEEHRVISAFAYHQGLQNNQ